MRYIVWRVSKMKMPANRQFLFAISEREITLPHNVLDTAS